MRNSLARRLIALVAFVLMLPFADGASPVLAEVNGTTWTSPTFGCQITWSSPWFFLEEDADGTFDYLALSDGAAFASFVCGSSLGLTPQQELTGVILAWCGGEGTSNCQPVQDDAGNSQRVVTSTLATDTYSFTQTYDDGTSAQLISRLDIRTVEGGLSIAAILTAEESAYPGYAPLWDELLTGIVSNVDTLPSTDPPVGPDPDPAPDPAPDPLNLSGGEAAPVMAFGDWRFAIASTTVGAAIPSLELEVKEGREWIAIVADISNWSAFDATFSLREPLVQTNLMTEPWDIAPASTRQVARVLQLTSQGNESVDIAAGASARVVLVYSIPAGGTNTWLLIGETGLVLSEHFDLALDPATLPAPAVLPTTIDDTLTSVSVNSAGAVTVGLNGAAGEYLLIGTDIPSGDECFGNEAVAYLLQFIDSAAIIESDPAVEGEGAIYLWIVQPDGGKALLNQQLLADGIARASNLPDEARFGSWMSSSEQTAQLNGVGLWPICGA